MPTMILPAFNHFVTWQNSVEFSQAVLNFPKAIYDQ
jgi:hypothetical protein